MREVLLLLMAASPVRLDCPALTKGLPSISLLGSDIGRLEGLSYPAGPILCWESQAASGTEGMPPSELHESSAQEFFGDPTLWWDNRWSNLNPPSPDFTHKISKIHLWLNNRRKPASVDTQLANWDGGINAPLESVCPPSQRQGTVETLGSHAGHLEIAMCRKLCEDGQSFDAVEVLNLVVQRGCHVDKNLYYRLLKRCIAHKDLVMGTRIHALITRSGYEGEAFLTTQLIALYASHGRLEDATQVFRKVGTPTTYNWATIIFAYARHGEAAQAIRLYGQMRESTTVKPGNHVYVAVLKACATSGDLDAGKKVHAHILASPAEPDIFIQTGLISMYAKCGSLGDARRVFDGLPERNVVAWTAMLAGYAQKGMGQEALSLYSIMQREGITTPDSVTFVCILQACATVGAEALDQGKQLHTQIEERGLQDDVVLGGSLVNMYAKCGSLVDARRVFDKIPERNVVAWTAMLAGYAQQGMGQEALSLYSSMQQEGITTPDSVTYICLLQACASVGAGALDQGKQLHAQIKKQKLQGDPVLGGSLVNMYAKCESLGDARRVFDRLPHRNVVAWNAMLAGYAQQGMGQEALILYRRMRDEGITAPDSVSFVCLLQSCASVGVGAMDWGKQLHAQIEQGGLQDDVMLGGSLVNMYAKCGSLGDARQVFERLREVDVVAWTAMLAGYAQQGMGQEALILYSSMQQEGLTPPNSVTFVCLLQASASVVALPLGKQLHAQIIEQGLQVDPVVGAALVNMYAKCGSMFESQQVFESLAERSIEAWGALIGGYTRQGSSEVVFDLVCRMKLEGIQPDGVTFLCLLTVCSHVGQVDEGRKYFQAMMIDYGISPTIEHYTCMVDLLGRAGHLDEALQIAKTMPFPHTSVIWLTLLGACQKWNNVEIGQQAFEFAVRVDGEDAASYVLMSNIYASAQMWEEANKMQARRRKSRAWKKPGQSWWTDMVGVVHPFLFGDKKHCEGDLFNLETTNPQTAGVP